MESQQQTPIMNKKTALGRQMFSPYEDVQLKFLVSQIGSGNWKAIASHMQGRTPRQCRERYRNYLAPDITNGPWTREEDSYLQSLYEQFGPKWSSIAKHFRNRSEVNIKNRWTSIGKINIQKSDINNENIQDSKVEVESEEQMVSIFDELSNTAVLSIPDLPTVWDYEGF